MANMLIDSNPLADYVVAKGKSGDWKYIKYANGFAQCWYTWSGSHSAYTTTHSAPYKAGHIVKATYPFTFYEAPIVTATCSLGNGVCFSCWGQGVNSTSSCSVYFFGNVVATPVSCFVNIAASGLWKALS